MKILVLLSRVPYPLEKGDKLRAFHQIKELSKRHKIALVALNDGHLHPEAENVLSKFCSSITIIDLPKSQVLINMARSIRSELPIQVGYFYFKEAQEKVNEVISQFAPDHIFCQLVRTTEYVKHITNIPKTLDYMDVFSKGMERRMDIEPFYMRPLLKMEQQRLLAYERKVFDWFDNRTIISKQDRECIEHPEREKIQIIPNGVDFEFFQPLEREKRFEILFNGNMSYPPNVESAEFLVKKILPLVHKKKPGVKVLLSGASPSIRVQALAGPCVYLTGWVRDIRESFAMSKILVAPMQISIGLQNKILEGMAMNMPCVTSTMANNAVGAEHGKNIMVANTPEEYAEQILQLLEDQQFAEGIAAEGLKFVRQNYDWEMNVKKLEELMVSGNKK